MAEESGILKLQVLLALYENEEKKRNVSSIAQALDLRSYQISRVLSALETEGLVDKSVERHPKLTDQGLEQVQWYEKRIHTVMLHLQNEGVDVVTARKDALYWSLYTTEETMQVLEEANERRRIKNELKGEKSFSGNILCKLMEDGDYKLTFVFYRIGAENGSVLSMANHGFENPCIMEVRNGKGTIRLKVKEMSAGSALDGHIMLGEVSKVMYFDGEQYKEAQRTEDMVSFPVNAIHFLNGESADDRFLNGIIKMKMQCSVGKVHMPESFALFSVII